MTRIFVHPANINYDLNNQKIQFLLLFNIYYLKSAVIKAPQ